VQKHFRASSARRPWRQVVPNYSHVKMSSGQESRVKLSIVKMSRDMTPT